MKCNYKSYGPNYWDGIRVFSSFTPCKGCKWSAACGFNKAKTDCPKFVPKGCKR